MRAPCPTARLTEAGSRSAGYAGSDGGMGGARDRLVVSVHWIETKRDLSSQTTGVTTCRHRTAELFGRRSVGMLFEWFYFGHQAGAALASYLGGVLFDRTGTYTLAFLSAGVLGIVAAALVLGIREPR